MQVAFCAWYEKKLEDVSELEMDACKKFCPNCDECLSFTFRQVPAIENESFDEFFSDEQKDS